MANSAYYYVLVTFFLSPAMVAGRTEVPRSRGYTYGQSIPVTCLNRTM